MSRPIEKDMNMISTKLPHEARVIRIVEERVKPLAKPQYCERVVQVAKSIPRDRVVEIPNVEIKELYETQVEYIKDTEFYDPAIHEHATQIKYTDVDRFIPVPIEEITTYEYRVSKFQPTVVKVKYPLYVPRFIEVPVPSEIISNNEVPFAKSLATKLSTLRDSNHTSTLQDADTLTKEAQHLHSYVNFLQDRDDAVLRSIQEKWQHGQLNIAQKISA